MSGDVPEWLGRYAGSLLPVFGVPQTVLSHGQGCYVVDVDGKRYLDLLGGIAVNTLGHGHPALVEAVTKQASALLHVSNFFTSEPQIELAETILRLAQAPVGSAVFFANSGTEAIEAAIKLTRRTGRSRIIAAQGSFHGRSTGALALTWKPAYREPFEPLIPDVVHVPYDDEEALQAAVTDAADNLAAVILEPIQGEGGVIPASTAYLRLARELTTAAGALLVFDEIQSGIGRTGDWFAFQDAGIVPDAFTLAKGLAGGVPIGAFGGNPLACAAGLATLRTVESDGLLAHAREMGEHLASAVLALNHPLIEQVRGRGLLRAIVLRKEASATVAARALEAGFLVNAVAPQAIRLAPPLVIEAHELDTFVAALPGLLEGLGDPAEDSA